MKTTTFNILRAACLMTLGLGHLSGLQAQSVTRGPYLQTLTQTDVWIQWRTDLATNGVVHYGTSWTNLSMTARDESIDTDHVVLVTGLTASTTYYYDIGTDAQVLAGGDSEHVFRTSPLVGTRDAVNVWVIGDSGTGDANAAAARDAYLSFRGTNRTDVWLMLGDNAYNSGTDAEHQTAVFDMYPSLLRQNSPWTTFGNHESYSGANSLAQTGAYYDIFSLPKNGEAGGVPTGTEAYYSFDYANIHFICLNSMDIPRTNGSAMLSWLEDDLMSTTQEWQIAFFHHPLYTKGSHDSDNNLDSEGRMRDMRVNVLPILEDGGVDLILSGHSHVYERSALLTGHYGNSSTFDPETMVVDAGFGREDMDGAYRKSSVTGQVFAVVGCSGKVGGTLNRHPAMWVSIKEVGSLVLKVEDQRLDATFLNRDGQVGDYFSLEHIGTDVPDIANEVGATNVTYESAMVRGELIQVGAAPTHVSVYWGTQPGGTSTGAWQHVQAFGVQTLGSLVTNLTGLLDDTTYYYRFFATNSYGSQWAPSTPSFRTPPDFATFFYKMRLPITGYAGVETLTNFPLKIVFDGSIPNFDYDQFFLPQGGDLRFSAQDQLTDLYYEIDQWNPAGESLLWVRIPQLRASNTVIWAHWGKPSAALLSGKVHAAAWSPDYVGVWHLGETGTLSRADSSPNANHAVTYLYDGSEAVQGWINGADHFGQGGLANALRVDNTISINVTDAITVSAWIRPEHWDNDNVIVRRDEAYRFYNRFNDVSDSFMTFKLRGNVNKEVGWHNSNMPTGQWYYVVGTYERYAAGNNLLLYVNGVVVAQTIASGAIPITGDDLMIGMKADGTQPFKGSIDEVRVSGVARSADWITACWGSQQPGASFTVPDVVLAVDLDLDGMADGWEIQNFGSITQSAGTVSEDYDADGASDGEEYIAGTSPTNRASVLSVEEAAYTAGVGDIIRWASARHRTYSIERSTNLVENAWSGYVSNLLATPPQNVHTATPPATLDRYYRIGVRKN